MEPGVNNESPQYESMICATPCTFKDEYEPDSSPFLSTNVWRSLWLSTIECSSYSPAMVRGAQRRGAPFMSEQTPKIRNMSDFDRRDMEKQNELNRAKKEYDLAYERKERALQKAWEDFDPYVRAFRKAREALMLADEEREEFRRTCLLDGRPLDSPVPMVSG